MTVASPLNDLLVQEKNAQKRKKKKAMASAAAGKGTCDAT
jgi:hypothetical protein